MDWRNIKINIECLMGLLEADSRPDVVDHLAIELLLDADQLGDAVVALLAVKVKNCVRV